MRADGPRRPLELGPHLRRLLDVDDGRADRPARSRVGHLDRPPSPAGPPGLLLRRAVRDGRPYRLSHLRRHLDGAPAPPGPLARDVGDLPPAVLGKVRQSRTVRLGLLDGGHARNLVGLVVFVLEVRSARSELGTGEPAAPGIALVEPDAPARPGMCSTTGNQIYDKEIKSGTVGGRLLTWKERRPRPL